MTKKKVSSGTSTCTGTCTGIVDVNVHIGPWPFCEFSLITPELISIHLKSLGIARAVCAPLSAVFLPDPERANDMFLEQIKGLDVFLPAGVVNPLLANWENIIGNKSFCAYKLIPNYHNYLLTDPRVQPVLAALEAVRKPLFVQVRFDDERNHYELLKVPAVPVNDILEIARAYPELCVIALGAYFPEAVSLLQQQNIYCDISYTENLNTLAQLTAKVPVQNILFGSQMPFLYTEAALGKLALNTITEPDRKKIASGNWDALSEKLKKKAY